MFKRPHSIAQKNGMKHATPMAAQSSHRGQRVEQRASRLRCDRCRRPMCCGFGMQLLCQTQRTAFGAWSDRRSVRSRGAPRFACWWYLGSLFDVELLDNRRHVFRQILEGPIGESFARCLVKTILVKAA